MHSMVRALLVFAYASLLPIERKRPGRSGAHLIGHQGDSLGLASGHRGAHTFLGMEAAVIKDIADWIKRYQAGAAQ